MFPLIKEIPVPDLIAVLGQVPRDGVLLLDSANQTHPLGRYSFLCCDPFDLIINENPFPKLEKALSHYHLPTLEGLPPFQGGIAGCFGYEIGGYLEALPRSPINDLNFPICTLGFYDLVLGIDHWQQKAWVFSSGFPEIKEEKRLGRAKQRMQCPP